MTSLKASAIIFKPYEIDAIMKTLHDISRKTVCDQ